MELLSTLEKIRRRAEVYLRALRLCFSRAVLYQKVNLIPNWISRGLRTLLSLPKFVFLNPVNCPEVLKPAPKPGSNPLKFAWLKRVNISARNSIPYRSRTFQFFATEKSMFFSPG